jgi:2-polyprenyl-3-methyl-5-hydroxy-6-metoxy-1,4-benzoquinol methylase
VDLIETQLSEPIKHWYYRHKYWAIKSQILKRKIYPTGILDIGAGSALFSLELQKEFPNVQVLAIDPGYSNLQLGMSTHNIHYSRTYSATQADLVLLTDVMEHVPDDLAFLSDYVKRVRVDSTFLITVPAFMSLWSNHDNYLKHFRRYRKNELVQVLSNSGLEVVETIYLYSLLFPIAFVKRKFFKGKKDNSDLKNDNFLIQLILNCILLADRFFLKFLPFGVSLLAVGVKRESNVG